LNNFQKKPLPEPIEASKLPEVTSLEIISSDEVIALLEERSPSYEFEKLGYEVKTTEEINSIYLTVNPDPRSFDHVTPNSLVISHHKVSIYHNRVYNSILERAEAGRYNLYNYHLGWDVMDGGIGDSFLRHMRIPKKWVQKVDLTYKNHRIRKLGAVVKCQVSIDQIISRLTTLNVNPTVIVNPSCCYDIMGYIPGGGFVDSMMIELYDKYGVDVMISSDPIWVSEIIARELGMTLIAIDHYVSERYGLQRMKQLLAKAFPKVPVMILEELDSIQCSSEYCDCEGGTFQDIRLK
jgi:putative NIF3 family GTP cyclohydrolase 1 type 2